jgi:integrase
MASIIPNPKRGTWQVQWFDGRTHRRKTVAGRRPGWKPGDGLPKKPPSGVLEALALYRRKEQAAKAVGRPAEPEETVADFLARYLSAYEIGATAGSVYQLTNAARNFEAFCAGAKVARVDQVTHDLIDRFLVSRSKEVKHNTVKKEASLLAGAWSKAVKTRRLAENPWKGATVPGKPAGPRKSSWTKEEYARLLAVSRPWLRFLLILGCNTGLRIKALTRLEWRDIAWNTGDGPSLGTITVRPELDKAGTGYQVQVSAEVHRVFAPLDPGGGGPHAFVLSGQGGGRVKAMNAVGDSIHRACKRAGLERPDAPNHAMRRTFGRWAVLGHLTGRMIPLYVVSKWLGHHSTRQTEEYLDLSEMDSAGWMEDFTGKGQGQ